MTFQNTTNIVATTNPQIVIERLELRQALEIASKCIASRSTVPVLQNAKIEGHGSSIEVTGTDEDQWFSINVPAAADSRFACTMPTKSVLDLVKKAPASDYVSLSQVDDEQMAELDFETVNYSLNTLPIDDFPVYDEQPYDCSFEVDGAWLSECLESVKGAMSTDDTRYYLSGVYMCISRDALRFVATDGHRLYKKHCDIPAGADDLPGVILPAKFIKLFSAMIKGKSTPEKIQVSVNVYATKFEFNNVTLVTKHVADTFPDFWRVIPETRLNHGLDAPAKILGEKVAACSLISSQRGRAIKLELSEGGCTVSANNPDTGTATAELNCSVKGDPITVGFNYKYLLEALKVTSPDGDNVNMLFEDNGSPARIEGTNPDFLAVLMPMRV